MLTDVYNNLSIGIWEFIVRRRVSAGVVTCGFVVLGCGLICLIASVVLTFLA